MMMPSCKWKSEYARWRHVNFSWHMYISLEDYMNFQPTNENRRVYSPCLSFLALVGEGHGGCEGWRVDTGSSTYQGVALSRMCLTAEGACHQQLHTPSAVHSANNKNSTFTVELVASLDYFFSMLSFIVYNTEGASWMKEHILGFHIYS